MFPTPKPAACHVSLRRVTPSLLKHSARQHILGRFFFSYWWEESVKATQGGTKGEKAVPWLLEKVDPRPRQPSLKSPTWAEPMFCVLSSFLIWDSGSWLDLILALHYKAALLWTQWGSVGHWRTIYFLVIDLLLLLFVWGCIWERKVVVEWTTQVLTSWVTWVSDPEDGSCLLGARQSLMARPASRSLWHYGSGVHLCEDQDKQMTPKLVL